MKKLIFALALSIFIHLLFLINYKQNQEPKEKEARKETKKTSIKYVKLKEKEAVKEIQKPKPKEEPKVENKPKQKEKQEAKKEKQEIKKEPKPKPKEVKTALQKEQERLEKENLSDFLKSGKYEPVELDRRLLDDITQSYLDLYGDEYDDLSETQKIFLHKNLKDIGYITQRYLRYPQAAIRLRQDGTNVIEFILHPNGDISNIILVTPSGSTSLDENTIYTVKIAYKDYPRPQEPTKIKIYVNYYLN